MAAASSLTPHWADPNQVNDSWLQPRIGHAAMTPAGPFEAGSYASLTITYTAGLFRDRRHRGGPGRAPLCERYGPAAIDDPAAPNYVSVEASNGAQLDLRFDPKGHIRPWDRTLSIRVLHGFLREGDTLDDPPRRPAPRVARDADADLRREGFPVQALRRPDRHLRSLPRCRARHTSTSFRASRSRGRRYCRPAARLGEIRSGSALRARTAGATRRRWATAAAARGLAAGRAASPRA